MAYDDQYRLERIRLQGRNSLNFSYDTLGRRVSYKARNEERTLVYQGGLPVKELSAEGETLIEYQYRPNGRPEALTWKGQTYTIEYNGDKLILLDQSGNQQALFIFDEHGQLKGRFGPLAGLESYLLYSRHSTEGKQQFSLGGIYPDPNKGKEVRFEYDQAGNLTRRIGIDQTSYIYDTENRLTEATLPGNRKVSYTYNALGYRDRKTTSQGTVYFVYDGDRLIAELDEDNNTTAWYSHDLYGKLVSVTYGEDTYFYHFNHRGDVLYLTDEAGNVAASYSYDAWGNILTIEGELANKNPYRYKGRYGYYYDIDSDLYLLSSRWYNPEIKRFMTRDDYRGEAAKPISLNRYAYCGNDPINYVDPMGTFGVTVSINGGGYGTSIGVYRPTVQEPQTVAPAPITLPPLTGGSASGRAWAVNQTSGTKAGGSAPTSEAGARVWAAGQTVNQPSSAEFNLTWRQVGAVAAGVAIVIVGGAAIVAALPILTGAIAVGFVAAAVSAAGVMAFGAVAAVCGLSIVGEAVTGKNPVRDFVGQNNFDDITLLSTGGSLLGFSAAVQSGIKPTYPSGQKPTTQSEVRWK